MAVDVVLEHVLLLNLRHAPLTRTELARRTSASERTVQAALDELVGDTYVVRRPQQGMPAEYELSAAGSMRLKVVAELAESPSALIGKAIGGLITGAVMEAARSRPPVQQPAEFRRPPARPSMVRDKLLLSDADRSLCSEALAEQFSLGRSAPLTANDRKLLRDLGVGVVFAGVLIVLHAPVMMAGVLVFTVSWRMFLTYRGWAKEHR